MNNRTPWERLQLRVHNSMLTLGVVNFHDSFIVTERKKRSADIILIEKQKKEYDNYVALADKAKELIEQKRVKDIDLHADESLHDRGVITSEQ